MVGVAYVTCKPTGTRHPLTTLALAGSGLLKPGRSESVLKKASILAILSRSINQTMCCSVFEMQQKLGITCS